MGSGAEVSAMTRRDREEWEERYRSGEFGPPEEASPLLERFLPEAPRDRALDVATGEGRNAVLMAERGFEVDAVDVTEPALRRARERAAERGVSVNWVRADLDRFAVPRETYSLVGVSFYRDMDLLTDLKEGLVEGGLLVYEHHLRSTEELDVGPPTDRHRLGSNELLRACLDLTVLHYEERSYGTDRGRGALARLVARRSRGAAQRYPAAEEQPY